MLSSWKNTKIESLPDHQGEVVADEHTGSNNHD